MDAKDVSDYIATLDPQEAIGHILHLYTGYQAVIQLHQDGVIGTNILSAYGACLTPVLFLLVSQAAVPGGLLPVHPEPGTCLCSLLGDVYEGAHDARG